MAIRTKPFPSKYIVDQEFANDDKLFGPHLRYEALLASRGGTVTDYTDLTELAKGFYSSMSETLSENTAPWLQWVLGTSGGYKDIDTQKVRWRTYGKPKRKFIAIGNPNNCQYIGAGGGTFKVLFDVDHFQPSDRLAPVEKGSAIIQILSHARRAQGGFEYEAKLAVPDTFLPKEYLVGKFWTRAGQAAAYSGPLSGEAGGFSYDLGFAYIEYEVPLHTTTLEYSVDMETHLKEGSLKVGCKYDDGTLTERITNRQAVEFDAAFDKAMEHQLIHGQMTNHGIDPVNRKSITTSPGLYAYLAESNIIKYNPFVNSIDMILDLIQVYWYDKVPTNKRNLVLMTGEGGLKLWHEWLLEKFGTMPVEVEHNFVLDSAKAHDMKKRGFALGGFQFTKYHVQPFGEVTVGHWPMLDDTLFDAVQMPNSVYTVRSHEFIAMDWNMGSQPNVQLLKNSKRDGDIIMPGYWTPWGAAGMKNPYFKTVIHPELDYTYKVRRSRTYGLAIMDVSKMLMFAPSVG